MNSEVYSGICLEGMRKTTKKLNQLPGRDLKPGPPEYEAGLLTAGRYVPSDFLAIQNNSVNEVTGYRLDDRGSIPYRFFILT
jgi:hypothetical protein